MGRITNLAMDILSSFDRFFDLTPYFREREVERKALRGWGYMTSGGPIEPGESRHVIMRPQTSAFRVIQINWDVEHTTDWTIVDIRVGNRSQFVTGHDIPLSKLYGEQRFETIQTAQDFIIVVRYDGLVNEGEIFKAAVLGEYV